MLFSPKINILTQNFLKMKKGLLFLVLLIGASVLNAQIVFDDYFINKSMRLDYFHTGNHNEEIYSIDEVIEEPFWGGPSINLIDNFDYGKFKYNVYDLATNVLIYSRGYSTLFAEWQTTEEARNTWRTYSETIVFPFPKKSVKVEFLSRNKKNLWEKKFEYVIDPSNYFIVKECKHKANVFNVYESGSPTKKLDIVIIPDGYTKNEMKKFHKDCNRFASYLLNVSPYKEYQNLINIRAVEAVSSESSTNIPAENIWKNTALGTTFYIFGTERYLMSNDNKTVRDYASNTYYDQIYILVNTEIYGGGGIYNYYSVCVSDNKYSDYIFIHEFGHGFAGLADEYYTSDVAVEDFYPFDVEPWEPNITTLVNFDSKWKNLLTPGVPIPTPDIKENIGKTGVFEGGGYSAKKIYRPASDCTMKSISYNNFCTVCKDAIIKMLKFYSDQ